jgi:translocation and assembly module TamB
VVSPGRNVKVTQTVNDAPLPVAFDTLNLSADLQ